MFPLGLKSKLRVGWIEICIWLALYMSFVIPIALGTTNTQSYFSQPNGSSLWAPLILGGAVNFTIMYKHAFNALPWLIEPKGLGNYAKWLVVLSAAYLAMHLAYQLALVWIWEPNLKHVTATQWTRENLIPLPVILGISGLYRIARDWAENARITRELVRRAQDLEEELHLVQAQLDEFDSGEAESAQLWFDSNGSACKLPPMKFISSRPRGNYMEIHTNEGVQMAYGSIKDLVARLPEGRFCRCHRSYIVNNQKIFRR